MNGTELRNLRRSAGVAMADLTTPLGVTEASISRYERGDSPMPEGFPQRYEREVLRIAEARAQAARMVAQEYREVTTASVTPEAAPELAAA